MLISSIILAISSSIDSFGIGITYGIKNMKISFVSKLILVCISFFITLLSVIIGKYLTLLFSTNFANLLGSGILFFIGIIVLIKAFWERNSKDEFTYDFNHSNLIDPKEAFVLGLALSFDSFGIGVSTSLLVHNSMFSILVFPLLVSIFQLLFLSLGNYFGRMIHKSVQIPDWIWSVSSGFLLVCIALVRFLSNFY